MGFKATLATLTLVGTIMAGSPEKSLAAPISQLSELYNSCSAPVEHEYNGHLYSLTPAGLSWLNAENSAKSLGGHLVTINDQAEQTWLNSQFSFPDQFWIGAFQDLGDPSYSEPAGGWKWINGESLAFTNWAGGEPNNNYVTEERWGAMHVFSEGLWADYHDDVRLPGIVERPVPEPSTLALVGTGALALASRRRRANRG